MKENHLFIYFSVVGMYEYSKLTYYYMLSSPGERSTRHMWNHPLFPFCK